MNRAQLILMVTAFVLVGAWFGDHVVTRAAPVTFGVLGAVHFALCALLAWGGVKPSLWGRDVRGQFLLGVSSSAFVWVLLRDRTQPETWVTTLCVVVAVLAFGMGLDFESKARDRVSFDHCEP